MDKIRVLVADDHPAFREGLCHLLNQEEDIEIVGMSQDGEEAVRLAGELQPDVAIIDISMPNVNGIQAAEQIRAICPQTAVLLLSAFDYKSYVVACLKVGAAGYMLKSAPVSEIVSAVRMVYRGEAVFDMKTVGSVLGELATRENAERKAAAGVLRERELQVLKIAARGASNKEIAIELGIGERTVQTHLSHAFRKLKVGSRTEAVLHALQEGWLTDKDLA